MLEAGIMLTLVFSKECRLLFTSAPDTDVSFGPLPADVGGHIQTLEPLIEADSALVDACNEALQGHKVPPCVTNAATNKESLRQVFTRVDSNGAPYELIVTYETGTSAAQTELMRKRLASAIDAFPEPVGFFDCHDRLTMFNTSYANLHTALDRTSIQGMHFDDILRQMSDNTGKNRLFCVQQAHIAKHLGRHNDLAPHGEMHIHDGRWFRVIDHSTNEGERVHILMDITPIKAAERRLREIEIGAEVGVWTLDVQTQISSVNDKWAEMLGFSHESLCQLSYQDWQAMVHPDDLASVEAGFHACVTGQSERFEAEYRIRHRSGKWVWIMGRGGISDTGPDGNVRQMTGITLDITHHKELEGDLALRAAAVAATHDTIMITDEYGEILDVNPALCKCIGVKKVSDIVGKQWKHLYKQEHAATLTTNAFPALCKNGLWHGHVIVRRLNGTALEQDISLTKMANGKIVWVGRDVSAQKALERSQERLRQDLDRAHRQEMLNLLSAGLIHDFSNLLAIISHLTDPDLGTAIDKMSVISKIHMLARQMIDMMEPINGFRRIPSMAETTDLCDVVRKSVELVKIGAPSQHLISAVLPETAILKRMEPLRLIQVLLNLGFNARDELGDNPGSITFSLIPDAGVPENAVLAKGKVPSGPFVLLLVSDTGSGINADLLDEIWTPGFTTKGEKSTGIGLPLVASIIQDVGAAIFIDSVPGKGTTFYVAWPLDESA
jgi:PAS domain S-box-containing protein